MCGECEQTLGEASATNNVCAGGYSTSSFIVPTLYFGFIKIFFCFRKFFQCLVMSFHFFFVSLSI